MTREWTPPTAAQVKKKWDDVVDDMLDLRRNYWLNHSYFMGDQWVTWNNTQSTVDVLDFSTDDEANTRSTHNKIKPRVLSRIARATQTPLSYEVRPEGVDQDAMRKASLASQVLDVEAHRADWEAVRADEIQFAILGAVSAVAVEPDWEYHAEPVPIMPTGELVRIPSRPAISVKAYSAAEFGLEPGSRSQKDARWWIAAFTLTPDQAWDRYPYDETTGLGLKDKPSPDVDSSTSSAMHRKLLGARRGAGRAMPAQACMVYVYYERPTNVSPGCVVHVVGNQVVQQSGWPFPFTDRLNVRVFAETPMGASWKGETIVNDARALQKDYNKAVTSINRHIGKADNARILNPLGSGVDADDLTGDVAEVLNYDANSGAAPAWMQAPQIPRWLREHVGLLAEELDELFSTHAVTRGQAPGDRNSGLALSILAEKDETPLGPFAANQQRGWQVVAEMVLSTMKHLMGQVDQARAQANPQATPMQVKDVRMTDDGQIPQPVEWTANDLPDRPVVHIPLEAVMPRSKAAVQDAMIRLAQSFPAQFASLPLEQLAKVLAVPNSQMFAETMDPQVGLAAHENALMLRGAVVVIDDWHDHAKHIAQHNDMRASQAYRDAPESMQVYIDDHVEGHALIAAQMAIKAAEAQAKLAAPQQVPPSGGEAEPDGPPEQQQEAAGSAA